MMNKDERKKMLDHFEKVNQEREDTRKFTASFFGVVSLTIGFYLAYHMLPPNDFISFIGFMFVGLVSSFGMLMLFSFIFRF